MIRTLRSGRRGWVLIFLAMLGIHLGVVATDPNFFKPAKPVGDGAEYESIAFGLYQGRGFWLDTGSADWRQPYEDAGEEYAGILERPSRSMPAVHRPPALPLLIASIYSVVGRNEYGFAAVRAMLASCSAVACFLSCLFVLTLGRRSLSQLSIYCAVACCFVLGAANRTLHSYSTDFLTEPIALLLLQLFAMSVVTWLDANSAPRRRLIWLLAAGSVFAALVMTRSVFILWLPLVALLIILIDSNPTRKKLRESGLFVCWVCVLCAPWWLHNCVATRALMPLGTQGPITLLGGYCAEALEQNGDWSYEPELRLRGTISGMDFEADLEREKSLSRKASTQVREWIANHLSSIPKLVCIRAYTHWNPYTGKSLIWKLLLVVGLLLLFPKDKRNVLLLAGLLAISTLITCSLYSVGGRFLVPLYGIQFSVAGIGVGMVIECLESFFNKRMGRNEAVS